MVELASRCRITQTDENGSIESRCEAAAQSPAMSPVTQTRGSCLCGGIRYVIEGELAPIQVCHCRQCRKAQGTPFATNIPVAAGAFRFAQGQALLSEFESSPGKKRVFCSRCGSPVYSRRDDKPAVVRIRAGTLDGPLATRPIAHFHTVSKCDWWPIDDALPRFEAGYVPKA